MPVFKMRSISEVLKIPYYDLIKDLYVNQQMSAQEISEWLSKQTSIHLTARTIQRDLHKMGIIRNFSQAFTLAIKKGRKTYEHLRRATKSSDRRKGIPPKLRYMVMQRDNFKCVLCGKTAQDDHLQIDHTIPIVSGGTNEIQNLRTLCAECNNGKMLLEERKKV